MAQLRNFFVEHSIDHFKIIHSDAHEVPLDTDVNNVTWNDQNVLLVSCRIIR